MHVYTSAEEEDYSWIRVLCDWYGDRKGAKELKAQMTNGKVWWSCSISGPSCEEFACPTCAWVFPRLRHAMYVRWLTDLWLVVGCERARMFVCIWHCDGQPICPGALWWLGKTAAPPHDPEQDETGTDMDGLIHGWTLVTAAADQSSVHHNWPSSAELFHYWPI